MAEVYRFGRMRIGKERPVSPAPGVWMIPGFGNTGIVETKDGLAVIDMPARPFIKNTMEMLRQISRDPISTVFLTHGHFDHAFHLNHLYEEAQKNGHRPPKIIAHRNILKRFEKYRMLSPYHDRINRIQFSVPEGETAFPLPERNPDVVFDQTLSTAIGGIDFHAYHGLGETDDHLWIWVPGKETVFVGDFVIGSFPNIGNPFKVQRYTLEWAETLEAIVGKEPEILVPGHGPVIEGRDKIREGLLKISSILRYLHHEVIGCLNEGMMDEDILQDVKIPEDMLDSEFLSPRYGSPSFVVHGILRQYTGWYDGNPSNLFPPRRRDVAAEIAMMAGKERVMARARKLKEKGRESMALHFVDLALAVPLDAEEKRQMHLLRSDLLDAMGHKAKSFISKNIYYTARDREKNFPEES